MRAMRALILTAIFAPVLLTAQQPPAASSPPSGVFPEQQGPVVNYAGYAYLDCGSSNAASIHIVALQGLVPDGLPKSPPRPSIEFVVSGGLDAVMGKSFTIAPKSAAGAGNALAMSCPVVGDCAAADMGNLSITGKAANGNLLGEFRAKWAIGAPRAGKFTVFWRESQAKCG
jgi:hypothetical protein